MPRRNSVGGTCNITDPYFHTGDCGAPTEETDLVLVLSIELLLKQQWTGRKNRVMVLMSSLLTEC